MATQPTAANVFSLGASLPKETGGKVFRSSGNADSVSPALATAFSKDRDLTLYPMVTGMAPEQVEAHITSGVTGPLLSAAEAATNIKQQEVYLTAIETSALDNKPAEEALTELQEAVESNPYLKAFISPAVFHMLKQSDNPVARRAAERKLVNVFMAAELINAKTQEAGKGFTNAAYDFVDALVSDLPVRSSMLFADRKEFAERFVQLLDSDEDPGVVRAELDKLLTEASDQGFLTQANRFYMNDFLQLATEGTQDSAAGTQQILSSLDIIAAVPGAIDIGKIALGKLTKATAANVVTDTARLTALATGDEKAVKTILDAARVKDDPFTSATSVANKSDSMSTPLVARAEDLTPAEATAMRLSEIENKAMSDAIDIRLTSGQGIDDEGFTIFANRLAKEAKDTAEKTGNLRFIDSKVEIADAFENVIQIDVLGTKRGRPFTSEKAAQKYAEQIGGAKVVPVAGAEKQFVVHKTNNVGTGEFSQGAKGVDILEETQLYKTTDVEDLGRGFWGNIGSPLSQTTNILNATLKRGEAARAKAQTVLDKDIIPVLKSVGRKGRDAVERVFTEIRDGSLAERRSALSVQEFTDYFQVFNKRLPTDKEVELYTLVQHRNDVDWYLAADTHFKREVNRGVEMLRFNNTDNAVQKISKAPDGSMVWDDDIKKFVKAEELGSDKQLFRLTTPVDFSGKLADMVATNVPKTRALRHSDVYGYNVGGSRVYPRNQTNWVIKQRNEVTLVDGRTKEVNPTAIMFARTEKEALKAVDEINTAAKVLRDSVNIKSLSKKDYYTAARAKEGDKVLDEAIANVSGWNPSVHSVKTLIDYFEDMGLDLRKTVEHVGDGEPLLKDPESLIGDITFKDVLSSPGTVRRADVRRDKALKGYGDNELALIKPLDAIQRSFSASIAKSTEAAYASAAINGVLRAAIEKGILTNIGEIRNMSLRQKVKNAKFLTSSDAGKKLELERKKIIHRLEKQNVFDAAIARQKDAMAQWVYDKGFKRGADIIDSLSSEPMAALRGITFDLYLGLFNPDQAWVQASQIANIVGMSKGTSGIRAVAAMPAVRGLILNGHPNVIATASKALGPAIGVSGEQFEAIVKSFMQSGRGMVQASLADLGEDSAGKVMLGKIRGAGRVFYNEGELAARISAHIVASIEYLRLVPDGDLLSKAAKNYVAHEADKFTNAMTSTSRNVFEQLPMFQFMSYTLRMAEFLTAGGLLGGKKVLTARQKLKLGSLQIALYGVAAIPVVGYQLDYFNFKYGQQWDQETLEVFRNGALDGIIEWMTGVESEVGRRLAWGEGVFTLMQNLSENSIFEVVGGPSVGWIKNLNNSLSKLAFNMKVGGTDFLPEDLLDVGRTIKTVNTAYNAYIAFKFGEYRSRSGQKLADDIEWSEAMAIAMGVPLEDVNSVWDNIENLTRDKEYYKSQAKKQQQLWDKLDFVDFNSKEAKAIYDALELSMAIHDPYEQSQIKRYIDTSVISLKEQIWFDAMRAQRNPK